MINDPTIKVPSLLIPTQGYTLLVPQTAVYEIASGQRKRRNKSVTESTTNADHFFWRNHSLTVFRFESGATVGPIKPALEPPLVVVIRLPQICQGHQAICLEATRIPSVFQATPRNLAPDYSPPRSHRHALSYALAAGQPVLIPDLNSLAKEAFSPQLAEA